MLQDGRRPDSPAVQSTIGKGMNARRECCEVERQCHRTVGVFQCLTVVEIVIQPIFHADNLVVRERFRWQRGNHEMLHQRCTPSPLTVTEAQTYGMDATGKCRQVELLLELL